jgi:hypothetical protein
MQLIALINSNPLRWKETLSIRLDSKSYLIFIYHDKDYNTSYYKNLKTKLKTNMKTKL